MITDRRGFLAALLAAPLAKRLLPLCCETQTGIEHMIHSNTWAVDPPLTEADFIKFLEEAMRWDPDCKPKWVIVRGELVDLT